MDIGAHCSISSCNQQDFLPFTCDCCHSVFCLYHRTYDAHECPNAGSRDQRVVQCPLCKQHLRWTAEQDVNITWEQHMPNGQCIPNTNGTTTTVNSKGEVVTQKKKKPRCSAENCREVLLTSNQFHCPKCNTTVCLRHRFEADHACEVRRQRHRQQRAVSYTNRSTKPAATTSKRPPQTAQGAATTAVATTKAAIQSLVQKGKAAANAVSTAASSVTSTSEQCPICQQEFAYVSQLIAHVNRMHPDGDTRAQTVSTTTTTGSERCPHCSSTFQDVMTLIAHVERSHPQRTIPSQAIAAGGEQTSRTGEDKCNVM